jgi:ribosomal protein S6--L-glutamate ligase
MLPYFVSFRPAIKMEVNLPPFIMVEDPETIDLLRKAAGVLLPLHVSPWTYRSITQHAKEWFPRLETRFRYQGKTRQVHLFRKMGVRHPESLVFDAPVSLRTYLDENGSPWGYPIVLKGDLGGGGETVFPIYGKEDVPLYLQKLPADKPLLIQKWVEHGGKDLRVVIYGDQAVSYFRVGGGQFYNNVCRGGRLDHGGWPELQQKGISAVQAFSRRAQIDIAGFDLMFPDEGEPVFIEVNFHFGRKGLGGTREHQKYVLRAIQNWRDHLLSTRLNQSSTG